MAQQFFYEGQKQGFNAGVLLCLNVLQKRGRKLLQVFIVVIVQDVCWDKDTKDNYMSRSSILMSKRALSFSKLSHALCAQVLLQWTIWWLPWGFLVAEAFLPLHQCLLLYILPWLWISQSFRIHSCTLLITRTKQRLCLGPAGSFCPSSPMDCLGRKFPSDLHALPSDTGVYSGCPLTAHLALGFWTIFLLLGQQLSCQWSYAGLPKTTWLWLQSLADPHFPGRGLPSIAGNSHPFQEKFRGWRLLLSASSLLVCTENSMLYECDEFSYLSSTLAFFCLTLFWFI